MSNWDPNAPAGQGGYGQPPQGGYGQPPQGGFGQPPQGGFGSGGFGQPPQAGFGPGGPAGPGQRPKKSNRMIIGIVVAGLAVLILAGVLIGVVFGGGRSRPVVDPPAPPTVVPTPTSPTTSPTTGPSPTQNPTTGRQAPAGAVDIGGGMSVTPASGWSVQDQGSSGAVVLRDGQGRLIALSTGTSADPQAEVQEVIDSVTESATDVRKTDVRTVEVHPSLSVASQHAVYTVAGQSGTATLWSYAVVSQRTQDGVGFAAVTLAPAADVNNEAFGSAVNSMIVSVLRTQVQE